MAKNRFEMDNPMSNRSLSSLSSEQSLPALSDETFSVLPSIDAPDLHDLLATKTEKPIDDQEFLASLLEFLSELPDQPASAFLSRRPNIDLDGLLDSLYELDDDRIEDWLIGHNPNYAPKLYEGLEFYLQLSDSEIDAMAH